ncbi:MAG: sigma-70 family RNA polymerase sigma factor [Anaerolineales bacterium]|nr:sigma-70 family RNA polymerase sigma factor [Anaerolineales bacterium]MCX7608300.1 sigma-70 family RNA polymerase sigma factor [Anaerolineales bacterium]MDW8227329.1 sigma-70 family RNA polymerase sigma factor [Anaerolineales bacterium]
MVTEHEEDAVLQRALQGDKEAFGWLYERYVERIYNYVYYRVGNPHDAEDITARVFYRAMHHIHHYTQRGVPFSAWLYRIAHNLIANWHRDRARHPEISLSDVPTLHYKGTAPEASIVQDQEKEALFQIIRRLSPERQHLLVLKFVEHLSNAEIGAIMGRSEGAIKSLYHRTLLALRQELEKIEKESE